jgi:hypothetical protein
MLVPSCTKCGCALDAKAAPRVQPVAAAWSLPPRGALVLKRAGILLGALGLYAAAKLGYDAAGASGALIAFGAGGFLLIPFVPERIS